MTRKALCIVSALFRLALLVGGILLLAALLRPICMDNGTCNYLLLALLVGIPFGIGKMIFILPPASYDIGGSIGVLAMDFLIGGVLGCIAIAALLFSGIVRLIAAMIQ